MKLVGIAALFFLLSAPGSLPAAAGEPAVEETAFPEGNISLPEARRTGGLSLMEALAARRTNRAIDGRQLPLQVLGEILWAGFGINRPDGRRTAPSANNRQEIDIYLALPGGFYLYDASAHALEFRSGKDLRPFCGRQPIARGAPAVLIYVADFDRMSVSPANRDFYAAADTGFISQNVYLYCASEGLATVVMGAVDRELLHREMELRESQKVILIQPVGYPRD